MTRAHRDRGFTLIELLVVVLLIVIVLGMVTVNLGPDRESSVRDEANRLALLLRTAQQEAILQGKILAVALETQGYYFLVLNASGKYTPLPTDDVLRARPLSSGITISDVNIEGAPETKSPRLILFPTGELPPFTVTLLLGDIRWQVQGTLTGEITAQVEPSLQKGLRAPNKMKTAPVISSMSPFSLREKDRMRGIFCDIYGSPHPTLSRGEREFGGKAAFGRCSKHRQTFH